MGIGQGAYTDRTGVTIRVQRVDDHLEVIKPGHYSASMYPESETSFFVPMAPGTARFTRTEDGRTKLKVVDANGKVHVEASGAVK